MNKITDISERINQVIDFLGVNKNDFAKNLGYNRSQAIYDIANGKSKPSFDFFDKLLNSEYSEILNIEYIITGRGKLDKTKSEEKATVYNGGKNGGKNGGEPKVKEMPPFEEDNTKSYKENNLIPLYDGVVTAGQFSVADLSPQTEPVEYVDAGDWFRDATAAMRVHDDSMFPEYKSGSIVALKLVKDKSLVVYGQDYVIETTEYRVIKRLQRSEYRDSWLLASVNSDVWEIGPLKGRLMHEPFDVKVDLAIRVFRVLGSVRRNESSRIVFNGKSK